MVKKAFFFTFVTLIVLFLGFFAGYSQSVQVKKAIKKSVAHTVRKADLKEIIGSQSLRNINSRVCRYNKYLCDPGAVLLKSKSVKKDFKKLYIAILLTESDNFKFNRGIYNKYDYGYPQINIKFWTLSKMQKMGYKITSYSELLSRPVLAIKIGEAIFWHNFIETWQNNNYPSLLDYATGYHNIACISKVYFNRLNRNYLDLKVKKIRKKILAMSFKTYDNVN